MMLFLSVACRGGARRIIPNTMFRCFTRMLLLGRYANASSNISESAPASALVREERITGPQAFDITPRLGYAFNAALSFGDWRLGGLDRLIDQNPAFCTGSLVSDRLVLTAAHCAWAEPEECGDEKGRLWQGANVLLSAYTLETGKQHYLNRVLVPPEGAKVVSAHRIRVHPDFMALMQKVVPYGGYDVALLELDNTVSVTPAKIASPIRGQTPVNVAAVIYGWGIQDPSAPETPTKHLKGLNVMIVSCEPYAAEHPDLAHHYDEGGNKYICIHKPETVGGTCHGDSGGPILVDNEIWGVLSLQEAGPGGHTMPACMEPFSNWSAYVNLRAPKWQEWFREIQVPAPIQG